MDKHENSHGSCPLNGSFAFLDVELANPKRDSVCSIGLVCVDDGVTTFEKQYLINPDCDFAPKNIRIHGITPVSVANAPLFPEVWEEISVLLKGRTIIAHNAASMDLNALERMLERYGYPSMDFPYFCTMKLAQKYVSECGGFGLETLCNFFCLPLREHHNSLADTLMCRDLLFAIASLYDIDSDDLRLYTCSYIDEDGRRNFVSRKISTERFACCSHYIECSDRRSCLFPNNPFYANCSYKKNLDRGRIFYGKNRNI